MDISQLAALKALVERAEKVDLEEGRSQRLLRDVIGQLDGAAVGSVTGAGGAGGSADLPFENVKALIAMNVSAGADSAIYVKTSSMGASSFCISEHSAGNDADTIDPAIAGITFSAGKVTFAVGVLADAAVMHYIALGN